MSKPMTKETILTPSQIHNNDLYDPDHPDADWSGFVSSKSYRKHIPSQPNQLAALNGNGFGPRNDVSTEEWTKPARKIVGHRESGAGSESNKAQSSTFTLIGGPVPENCPAKFASECWETEAQAGTRTRNTEGEHLTDRGRRKRRTVHAKASEDAQNEIKPPICHEPSPPKDPSDFIGFRSSNCRVSCIDTSFLVEVGEAVASFRGSSSSFPTDSSALFVDPYKSASGERREDLLVENFTSTVPGYTDKRTFIS